MDKELSSREKLVTQALGIVSVEGKKPSSLAVTISKQFASGEISAAQAKTIYLKKRGLAP